MKYNQLTFILEKCEVRRAKKWIKKQNKRHKDVDENRFSYSFTPTGLSEVASIMDNLTGRKKVLTKFKK